MCDIRFDRRGRPSLTTAFARVVGGAGVGLWVGSGREAGALRVSWILPRWSPGGASCRGGTLLLSGRSSRTEAAAMVSVGGGGHAAMARETVLEQTLAYARDLAVTLAGEHGRR